MAVYIIGAWHFTSLLPFCQISIIKKSYISVFLRQNVTKIIIGTLFALFITES